VRSDRLLTTCGSPAGPAAANRPSRPSCSWSTWRAGRSPGG